MSSTLFQELGGSAAIDAAVAIFYRKVLVDARIAHFFEGVDMDRLANMQKSFLTLAFGGSNEYKGQGMRNAHASLVARGLNDTHFDAVVELLGQTLQELGVKPELIANVAEVANSVRSDVLGK